MIASAYIYVIDEAYKAGERSLAQHGQLHPRGEPVDPLARSELQLPRRLS